MSKVKVTSISELKTENRTKDQKANRQFYTIKGFDVENPLTGNIQRNFFQAHSADGKSAFWKGADYSQAKGLVGQEIVGDIVRGEVKPYDINGRLATSFTCLVLKGETFEMIAKQNGHEAVASSVSAAPAKETV